jgi:hypothetical protein
MKKQTVVATVLLFLAAALPPSAQGQPPTGHETPPTDHTIFKAQGFNVNTFLEGVSVNGLGSGVFLEVFQDPQSGDTSLLLHVFAFYPGNTHTEYFLSGTIPSTDFVIAPDLSSATLTTTINSSPGQFDDPDIGPIVGLVINLTWAPDAFGHRNVSSNFRSGIPGHISFEETFHQNGKVRFGPMSGSFGTFEIQWFGELNENRTLDIVRTFLLR